MTKDVEKNTRAENPEDNERVWADKKAEIREKNSGTYKGFIAQQLEKVFPEWVNEDEDGYKTINTGELPFVIVEAIKELKQEQDAKMDVLEQQLTALKEENKALRQRLEALGG